MISERLAKFVEDLNYREIPEEVIEYAKLLFLDFIGLPFKGYELDSAKVILKTFENAHGNSIALPTGNRYLPQISALINSFLAHSLDFDDTHRKSSMHPSVCVFPPILTVDTDGRTFLEGVVAGYEVACRLGMAINPKVHYDHGFHITATCGIFGGISALSKILDFDCDKIINAYGTALSMVSGTMQFLENGSWNKRLNTGIACHNAVISVNLAKNGFLGAGKPIEGKYGFLNSYTHNAIFEKAVENLGKKFEITNTGIKLYPCCRYIHPVLDLIVENNIKNFNKMTIKMVSAGYKIVGDPIDEKRNPKNMVSAQFSLPFAVAVLSYKGKLTVDDFMNVYLNNEIVNIMNKIDVYPDEKLDNDYPEKWKVVVNVDDKIYSRDYPKGEPEDPARFKDVFEKFSDLTDKYLSEDQRKDVLKFIKNIENRYIFELFEIMGV